MRTTTQTMDRAMRATALIVALAVGFLATACSGNEETTVAEEPGWTRISSSELSDLMATGDVYLVNVHVPNEGEIPGTDAHVPYTDIAQRADELSIPAGQDLVIYCRSGNMSTEAAQEMVDAGVTGFFELEGGFVDWQAAGLPFET